jgi:hypothetical protein
MVSRLRDDVIALIERDDAPGTCERSLAATPVPRSQIELVLENSGRLRKVVAPGRA